MLPKKLFVDSLARLIWSKTIECSSCDGWKHAV